MAKKAMYILDTGIHKEMLKKVIFLNLRNILNHIIQD